MIFGTCLSIEEDDSALFIHGAYEAASLIGASFGPTLRVSKEHTEFGVAGTIFGGLVVLPYYRYTYLPHNLDFGEVGSFLKFPIPLAGTNFNQ